MTLRYLIELYTKARIMSWLTHGCQSVYVTTPLPGGVVQTSLVTFQNGRVVAPETPKPPASLFPDHVPDEWTPKPPTAPGETEA
jgi:hypothetical protein